MNDRYQETLRNGEVQRQSQVFFGLDRSAPAARFDKPMPRPAWWRRVALSLASWLARKAAS